MRTFFLRRKRKPKVTQEPQMQNYDDSPPIDHQQQQDHSILNVTSPIVERKIHPNLNALADELEPFPHGSNSQKAPPISYAPEYHERRSSSVELQPLSPSISKKRKRDPGGGATQTSQTAPNMPAPPPTSDDSASGIFTEWPTFGRKASQATVGDLIESNAQASSTPNRRSKSWRRQRSQSWGTTRSQSSAQSPESSSYPYMRDTPTSDSRSSQFFPTINVVPSPNIFGLRRRSSSGATRTSSYFPKVETPPPLPPLNHPAFHLSSGTFGRTSAGNPATHLHEDEGHVKGLRVSHSLPAISAPARATHATERGNSIPGRRRARSTLRRRPIDKKARRHSSPSSSSANISRNSSRNSNHDSHSLRRRSSAEMSSKRASSTGQSGEQEKSWEVQVAKEVLRKSFGSSSSSAVRRGPDGGNGRSATKYGSMSAEARGNNQQSFGRPFKALGSPFFLQDTHTHYLPDTHFTSTKSNDIYPSSSSATASRIKDRRSLFDIMSQDDNSQQQSQRRDKGKGKEVITPTPSSGSMRSAARRTGSGSGKLQTTPSRTRTPPPPHLRPIPDFGPILQSSPSNPTLQVTAPTPVTPVAKQNRRIHHKSSPAEPPSSVVRHTSPPQIQKSHSSSSAGEKRKVDEVEGGTPPKDAQKEQQRATFSLEPRPHRASAGTNSSYAPSSFHRQKRARLSMTPEASSRPPSRSGSTAPQGDSPNAKNGTWSSKTSAQRAASQHGSYAPSTSSHPPHRAPSRRSLSQTSIPISALISPHAPSVATSGRYHMRDPKKPTVQNTPWSLSFPDHVERGRSRWGFRGWEERGGSPLHAWLFFIGFILFPLWWAAALFIPIPRTRQIGANEAEKGVILDDPQVEHDAKSWRTRCRVMAVVSFFTYVPFIILVAIFARR